MAVKRYRVGKHTAFEEGGWVEKKNEEHHLVLEQNTVSFKTLTGHTAQCTNFWLEALCDIT